LHDCRIVSGGVRVYPRLIPGDVSSEQPKRPPEPALATGIPELDGLLGGPIPWGFGVMINGPAGCGKSSLAAQLAVAAANQGQQVCMYSFEESTNTLLNRCDKLGIGLRQSVQSGRVQLQKLEASRITPGEITHAISGCIKDNSGLVVIDSLNGYVQTMRSDRSLVIHLHELLDYLKERAVITVLVAAQHGVLDSQQSEFDATYLADLVIQIRYFEAQGLVREAISVTKNRAESHEKSIREFDVGKHGIRIGQPLRRFQGVLTGVPAFVGESESLIGDLDKEREN
jgi:circadian clock protein KaiC